MKLSEEKKETIIVQMKNSYDDWVDICYAMDIFHARNVAEREKKLNRDTRIVRKVITETLYHDFYDKYDETLQTNREE